MTIQFDPGKMRRWAEAIGEVASAIRGAGGTSSAGGGNAGFRTTGALFATDDELASSCTAAADAAQSDSDAMHQMANSFSGVEDSAESESNRYFGGL